MAQAINLIFDFMDDIIRKQKGVYINISQGVAAINRAQKEKIESDFKLYSTDQTVRDSLKPFKVTQQQFTSAADGQVTFPSNYLHFLGGAFTVTGSTINQVNFFIDEEKPEVLTNQLRPVSLSKPKAELSSVGFQLYPQSVQIGFYNYLRYPADAVYDYTQVGRTITYNAAGSTQLEWSDVYVNNIIARALAYWGIYVSDKDIIEFSQLKQQQTDV